MVVENSYLLHHREGRGKRRTCNTIKGELAVSFISTTCAGSDSDSNRDGDQNYYCDLFSLFIYYYILLFFYSSILLFSLLITMMVIPIITVIEIVILAAILDTIACLQP